MERISIDQMPKTIIENEQYLIDYVNFINSRPERDLKERNGKIWEVHHVIPKSFDGSNEKSNLIKLELKEHYQAHLLLYKAYRFSPFGTPMIQAFWSMTNQQGENMLPEEYEQLRVLFINSVSGEKHANHGKSIYDLMSLDDIISAVEKRKNTIKNWSQEKKEEYSRKRSEIATRSNRNRSKNKINSKKKTKIKPKKRKNS